MKPSAILLASLALTATATAVAPTTASAVTSQPGAQPAAQSSAASDLTIKSPSLFTATVGAWVTVRVKVKNTSDKAAKKVVLRVTPKKGSAVSRRSIALGKIPAGATKSAVVRIRAGKGTSGASLKAAAPGAGAATTSVTIIGVG